MLKFILNFLLVATTSVQATLQQSPFLNNGTTASPGQFPFLAHISFFNETSGSTRVDSAILISDRHLLAKAEFLKNWGNVTALLGAHQPYVPESSQQSFFVNHAGIIFPDPIVAGFDLAIIPLPEKVQFSDRVQPILLPQWSEKGSNYAGVDARIIAWMDPSPLTVVAYNDVEIRPHSDCGTLRQPEEMCVAEDLMSAGDNGAPLVVYTDNGPVAVGIFSYYVIFRNSEAEWVRTNIFIRLNEHLDFIAEHTGVSIRP